MDSEELEKMLNMMVARLMEYCDSAVIITTHQRYGKTIVSYWHDGNYLAMTASVKDFYDRTTAGEGEQ